MVSARRLFWNISSLVCFSVLFATSTPSQTSKPNIVFILVDNVGWGDFGVYGGTTATPRIDQMAREGIRFNNYNVEAQCTPKVARVSLPRS
jgi:arylsulfatase